MEEYKLSGIMSTDVLFVEADAPLNHIATLMSEQKYSCLLVVQDKKPIGIITERDLVSYLSNKLNNNSKSLQKENLPVAVDLMSYNLIMLQQNQNILDALVVCIANNIRHIPVLDCSGYLVGIVTYTDIADFQRNIMESQSAIIEKSISERTSDLMKANQRLKEMTLTDPLLEIGNRRAMEIDVKCTHDLSRRYADDYAIVMIDIDIDNFKLYNDYYGHQAGDETLQRVTKSIKSSIRTSDRIYRYGGEELLVLLPQTESEDAKELANRVLDKLIKKIPHCKSPYDCVTVSCGIGLFNSNFKQAYKEWSYTVKIADEALYSAKNAGRNRVSIYSAD